MAGEPARINVIQLYPPEAECVICGAWCLCKQGVPIYEDVIVPDDYDGEWGGAPACLSCYYIVRGIQSEQPGQLLPMSEVRKLARPPEPETT